MKILEGKCSSCSGNVILEDRVAHCENCGKSQRIKLRSDWLKLLNLAENWGPKESRCTLTWTGSQIVNSYKDNEPVDCTEAMDALEASHGVLIDPTELKHLRDRGLIL